MQLQVVWGATDPLPEPPAGVNCRIVTLDAVEQLGRRHPRAHVPPKLSDTATLCYTSGTTGQPKGGQGKAEGQEFRNVMWAVMG
jgi:long-chain acyl-CoA synthetase